MYLCIVEINFHDAPEGYNNSSVLSLLNQIEEDYCHTIGQFDFHFVSEEQLLLLNKEHLNHDTHTDVITFDYSSKECIEGEAFIGTERAKENAKLFSQTIDNEINRLIIHAVLHCLGVTDKTEITKREFRKLEDNYLSMFHVKP